MSSSGRESRATGWARWSAVAVIPLVLLAAPSLERVPARVLAACAAWIALAGSFELLSIVGFIAVFALVFGAGWSGRQSLAAALRALGASTVLPGGTLFGPAIGVRSAGGTGAAVRPVASSTIAFVLLTAAPGIAALALVGVSMWLGWLGGPHCALLTLAPAALASALLAAVWLLGRAESPDCTPPATGPRWRRLLGGGTRVLREGAAEAERLLSQRNWKLLGPLAYYAFDNAVLWAAFRASGAAPPAGVILMGYLVGSLGAALPVPGGVGAAEGGLIGALVLYGAPAPAAAGAVLLYRGISLGLPVTLSAAAWALVPPSQRPPAAERRARRRRSYYPA